MITCLSQADAVQVPTIVTNCGHMVPTAEVVFPTTTLNRTIQACRVRANYQVQTRSRGTNMRTFVIYFRYDDSVMRNISLANSDPTICWRGEVLVMKVGVDGKYVNMRGPSDRKIGQFIVKEYVS